MKSKKMIKLLGLALSGVLIFSALTGCGAKKMHKHLAMEIRK